MGVVCFPRLRPNTSRLRSRMRSSSPPTDLANEALWEEESSFLERRKVVDSTIRDVVCQFGLVAEARAWGTEEGQRETPILTLEQSEWVLFELYQLVCPEAADRGLVRVLAHSSPPPPPAKRESVRHWNRRKWRELPKKWMSEASSNTTIETPKQLFELQEAEDRAINDAKLLSTERSFLGGRGDTPSQITANARVKSLLLRLVCSATGFGKLRRSCCEQS